MSFQEVIQTFQRKFKINSIFIKALKLYYIKKHNKYDNFILTLLMFNISVTLLKYLKERQKGLEWK
jgi:hypothetical protein